MELNASSSLPQSMLSYSAELDQWKMTFSSTSFLWPIQTINARTEEARTQQRRNGGRERVDLASQGRALSHKLPHMRDVELREAFCKFSRSQVGRKRQADSKAKVSLLPRPVPWTSHHHTSMPFFIHQDKKPFTSNIFWLIFHASTHPTVIHTPKFESY